MRIGIDVSRTAEQKTGLGSYATSLVAGLARIDHDHDYVMHPFTWHCFVDRYDKAFCPRVANFRNSRWWLPRKLVTKWWHGNTKDKDWLVGGPHDVFFSPFHAVPPRQMGKLVCVFHDVAFFAHPEFSTEENRAFCAQQIDLARRRADLIVTVSEFSRREILRYVDVPESRVRAIHEAADPRYRKIPGARVPDRLAAAIGSEPFTLFVGSVEPRKNLATLVRAWARAVAQKAVPGKLVIAGGSGWKNSDVYAAVERQGLQDRVTFTGFVSDAELVALYNTARMFVYPTIYEGFGLPVIEAMACGTPVVTTRVASIPEVGGDAVCYVADPHDDEALAAAMIRMHGDAAERDRLAAAGLARAATFSWDKAARATLAVLEEVVRERSYDRHAVVIGSDERALDRGWYAPERAEDFEFRWAARRSSLVLTPRAGTPFTVELGTPLGDGEQNLELRVAGRPIERRALRHGWQRLEFAVPGLSPERAVPFELVVDRGLDSRHKGQDPRDLAIMVRRAGF